MTTRFDRRRNGSLPQQRNPMKIYWTMEGEGHTAQAMLFTHPLGFELEIRSDGEMQRTQVYRVSGAAERDALATMERLEARGWKLLDAPTGGGQDGKR